MGDPISNTESHIREIDNYYLQQTEPAGSCLLALRKMILDFDVNITEAWKYRMPFFCFHGKMFAYLWIHKKKQIPFIGIVEGKNITFPKLIHEDRARIKIMLVDPEKDIPVRQIRALLKTVLKLYHDKLKAGKRL